MKGMNQTLALIVGAVVLMMTALTVIFVLGEQVPDAPKEVEVSGCRTLAQTQCSDSSEVIQAPSACTDDEGNVPDRVVNQVDGLSADGSLSCSEY